MDQEARKRVNESKRSVPKSKNPGSFAASSSDPAPSSVPKKKPRRRKETESEKVFSLQDPGILDQKEENGKVYYLLNWADDPDTGEQFKPSWVSDLAPAIVTGILFDIILCRSLTIT